MGFGKSILKEDVASPFKIDVAASCDEILKGIGNGSVESVKDF